MWPCESTQLHNHTILETKEASVVVWPSDSTKIILQRSGITYLLPVKRRSWPSSQGERSEQYWSKRYQATATKATDRGGTGFKAVHLFLSCLSYLRLGIKDGDQPCLPGCHSAATQTLCDLLPLLPGPYHFHPCWSHFGPCDLLVVFRTWYAFSCHSLCAVCSSLLGKFLFIRPSHGFQLPAQISPPRHIPIPKKTSSASFYSLNLVYFPSKHISLLETMFFVCLFHWNINSECGDLAFLLPVEFSVLRKQCLWHKRCSINICWVGEWVNEPRAESCGRTRATSLSVTWVDCLSNWKSI